MGNFIIPIAKFLGAVLGFTGAGTGLYFVAVQVARIGLLALAAKLTRPKQDLSTQATNKLLTRRDTISPQNYIYGEDMVSGPLAYTNVAGTENRDLFFAIILAGHECEDVISYRIDDTDIPLSDVSGAKDGTVNGGIYNGVAEVEFLFGVNPQTRSVLLNEASSTLFVTAHRGNDWAYMVWKFTLVEGSEGPFKKGAPQNMRAVVRGRKVYDPRLDSSPGDDPQNASFIVWSDNPALCLADFIRDDSFGMKEIDSRVDWPMVVTAADICDELVTIPTATTQKRYTCNATFSSTENRGNVRDELLSAMLGRMVFSQGLWKIWAGAAIAPDVTLTEANLGGQITLQASAGAKERYNRVRGKFIDPDRDYTANSYPEQRSSVFVADDGGEVRPIVADFTSSNTDFEAQRKAIVTLKQSRNQRVVVFEGNYSCFRIQAGSTVLLTIAEYGFSGEKFFVTEWGLTQTGVSLTMVQEVDTVWADPMEGDYTIRTNTGVLVFGETGVPPPTAPTIGSVPGGIKLTWTNPPRSTYDVTEIHASDDNVRANAEIVATVSSSSYVDQVSDDRIRFYWLRNKTSLGAVSTFEPDLTTTTLSTFGIIDIGVNSVPSFTPGFVGGKDDFVYVLNKTYLDAADNGEIKVTGLTFEHPDGTVITTDSFIFEIRTPFEAAVVGRFFIMFSAAVAETRFGGVAADWGDGAPDDTRFVVVTHNSVDLWRARNNAGTFFAFTPLVTDCIIAVCDKQAITGGIEAINPVTGGLAGVGGGFRDIKFRRDVAQPATPTGDSPSGWTDFVPTGTAALWQIVGNKNAAGELQGVWSTPALTTGMTFRGPYQAGTDYIVTDVVTFQGRTYICVLDTIGNAPSGTNASNTQWDILAAKGDAGDPPSPYTETIAITGSGPKNLRSIANAHSPPYEGGDATITFTVAGGITITGNANGGDGLVTGSWPGGATIDLTLDTTGTIRGGGGRGGNASSGGGGTGGDAINCTEDLDIQNQGGLIQSAGGGGGAGGRGEQPPVEPLEYGGGGGGGASPNGSGGNGENTVNFDGADGNNGTTSAGGTGGLGASPHGGNGGQGGGYATNGAVGQTAELPGGAGGAQGFAVRKNGHTVPVTGGTVTGTVG